MANKRNLNCKKGGDKKIIHFVSKQEGSYGFGRKRKKKKRKEEKQAKVWKLRIFVWILVYMTLV